jgi:phage N-6-adenine-methyltransferase
VTLNSGVIEWYTPPEYLERVRAVLGGIDLDPASSKVAQKTVKAKRYFTKVEDAINSEWHGRIFMNPPYCRDDMPRFVEKLIGEFRAGRVSEAIALVHSLTDPGWFHDLARCASALCFTRGRIPFLSPYGEANAPVHGSAFFYLGPCPAKFVEEFGAIGLVVLPVVGL